MCVCVCVCVCVCARASRRKGNEGQVYNMGLGFRTTAYHEAESNQSSA